MSRTTLVVSCAAAAAGLLLLVKANSWLESLPPLAGGCEERQIATAASPSGRYVAAAFARECGATAGVATHVNLRDARRPFRPAPDGLIREGSVFEQTGLPPISLAWTAKGTLVVKCPLAGATEEQVTWGDVKIVYRDPTQGGKAAAAARRAR